jgi:hypothetical protein
MAKLGRKAYIGEANAYISELKEILSPLFPRSLNDNINSFLVGTKPN